MVIKKHVAQSNDGTYLAISHLDLGGNDVVHKLDIIRTSVPLGHFSTLPRSQECSCSSLFLFYTTCHNQNIVQRKTEFRDSSYFHRTVIGFKLPV